MPPKPTADRAAKTIRVYLRVRPPSAKELNEGHTFANLTLDEEDGRSISVNRRGEKGGARRFTFDRVFPPTASQRSVYEAFGQNAVEAAFRGEHGVLFAYGQTGSGKTFTISNDEPSNLGVLQQSMIETWNRIAEDRGNEYHCSLSYVQLYNEILTDLLDAGKRRVRLQLGPEGCGDVVMVCEDSGESIERDVRSYEDTMRLFHQGIARKEMAATDMNLTSSRSHTVFCLTISKSTKTGPVRGEDVAVPNVRTALEGKLFLCDLAGSERVGKSKAAGKTLNEATHINGSLLVLGKVVAALTDKTAQFAPFRESKLTRILQYGLMGNGDTSIIVNCSPSDDNTDETYSTVLFGMRAIQIKQDAKRHEVLDYKALYLQLQAQMDHRSDEALQRAMSDEREYYGQQIEGLNLQIRALEEENAMLRKELGKGRPGGTGNPSGAVMTSGGSALSNPNGAKEPGKANPQQQGSASGSIPSSGTGETWTTTLGELRSVVRNRDERLGTLEAEKRSLQLQVDDEKMAAMRLAQQLKALMLQFQLERTSWMREVNALRGQLASLQGTEYLSTDGGFEEPSPSSLMSPAIGFEGNDAAMMQYLDRAHRAIVTLHDERASLLVYQHKAQTAIKYLSSQRSEADAALRKMRTFVDEARKS